MKDGLLIHAGINFILFPQPPFNPRLGLKFLEALMDQGVEITESHYPDNGIIVACREPISMEVHAAPVGPNVGHILIIGGQSPGSIDLFSQRVEAVLLAYEQTLPAESRKILAADITLRFLYDTGADHAFRQLWENRLHQSSDALATLGGPVLGGGLRFVVPLVDQSAEPCIVEVKIESLLADADKLYVETVFKWNLEGVSNAGFDAIRRLMLVDKYIEEKVGAFMDWEENNHDSDDAIQ